MSIVEKMLPLERNAFIWLNDLHTPFLDTFMYTYSAKFSWLALLVVALYVFVYKVNRRDGILLFFCMILIGVLCDQISSEIIKPHFSRYRPTHHSDFKEIVNTVFNYRGGRLGFVSSHAANGFGISVFVSLVVRNKWLTLTTFLWATITSYSRIYLGVHFITDVLGGLILGVASACFVYFIYLLVRRKIFKIPRTELTLSPVSRRGANIVIATICTTVLSIILVSALVLVL